MPEAAAAAAELAGTLKTRCADEEAAEPTKPAAKTRATDRWLEPGANARRAIRLGADTAASMAIPDEVAQYAEGKRIVCYFPLGQMQDDDQQKNIWLWTTTTDSKQPYDFDSFRVFVWSLKPAPLRNGVHRTQYRVGTRRWRSPVHFTGGKGKSTAGWRRISGIFGVRGEERWAAVPAAICRDEYPDPFCRRRNVRTPPAGGLSATPTAAPAPAQTAAQPPRQSFSERVRKRLKALTGGWFGSAAGLYRLSQRCGGAPLCYLWVQVGQFDPTRTRRCLSSDGQS